MIPAIILAFLVVLLFFLEKQYSHRENAGFSNVKPKIPWGNLESIVKKKRSFATAIYDIYKQTAEPFIGIYLFFSPAILVRDQALVEKNSRKIFSIFTTWRILQAQIKYNVYIFALPGEAWKSLRNQLTPAFTSGKLKGMFPQVLSAGNEIVKLLKPLVEESELTETRDLAITCVINCLIINCMRSGQKITICERNHEI